jgi:ribonuclease T2
VLASKAAGLPSAPARLEPSRTQIGIHHRQRQWNGIVRTAPPPQPAPLLPPRSRPYHFTLHGLWPNFEDGTWPQFCDTSYKFDEEEVRRPSAPRLSALAVPLRDPCDHSHPAIRTYPVRAHRPCRSLQLDDIEDELEDDWPSFMGPDATFWEHEWSKHGTCALSIFSSEYKYFKTVLRMHHRYDLGVS